MFERFTERARRVVVCAQDEARAFKHNYVGTEHILLGLLLEDEGLASRVLTSFGVTLDEVRHQVSRVVGQGDGPSTGHLPFTPRAKKTLDLALREALALGHNYIGTEHVLLGLMREGNGVGVKILRDFDVDAEKVRNEVIAKLAGPARQRRGEQEQEAEKKLAQLVKAQGQLNRLGLQAMRAQAEQASRTPHLNRFWVSAYLDLARAADRLDAMLARTEVRA